MQGIGILTNRNIQQGQGAHLVVDHSEDTVDKGCVGAQRYEHIHVCGAVLQGPHRPHVELPSNHILQHGRIAGLRLSAYRSAMAWSIRKEDAFAAGNSSRRPQDGPQGYKKRHETSVLGGQKILHQKKRVWKRSEDLADLNRSC